MADLVLTREEVNALLHRMDSVNGTFKNDQFEHLVDRFIEEPEEIDWDFELLLFNTIDKLEGHATTTYPSIDLLKKDVTDNLSCGKESD